MRLWIYMMLGVSFLFSSICSANTIIETLKRAAATNSVAAGNEELDIVMSGLEFDDEDRPIRVFLRQVRELDKAKLESVIKAGALKHDPGSKYYAILLGGSYLGGAIGKNSTIRILREKDGKVYFFDKRAKESALLSANGVKSQKAKLWNTCSCGMTQTELLNGWLDEPELAPYLKANPFIDQKTKGKEGDGGDAMS